MTGNPIQVFDRNLVAARRKRFHSNHKDFSFLHDFSQKEFESRMKVIKKNFPRALQIGSFPEPPDTHTHGIKEFYQCDLFHHHNLSFIADEEFLPIAPHSMNLITSHLNLHTVNDLPGCLLQINQALCPDGLFMASVYGNDTLIELRHALSQAEMEIKGGISPRLHPFIDLRQMGSLMQRANFSLPVIDVERVCVTYDHITKLLNDLRYMAQGNALLQRAKTPLSPKIIRRANEIYHDLYPAEENRLRATFDVIFVLGWAPHSNQQKPLQPGSAKKRLADSLKTYEEKLPC